MYFIRKNYLLPGPGTTGRTPLALLSAGRLTPATSAALGRRRLTLNITNTAALVTTMTTTTFSAG
jgi:hypothetical protein